MKSTQAEVVDLAAKRRSRGVLLDRLFVEYEPALRRFLSIRRIPESEVGDLIQDVYLKLAQAENLARIAHWKSGSTCSYIFSIANSLIVDRSRRWVVQNRYLLEEQNHFANAEDGITPETILSAQEELWRVEKALHKLKGSCRDAFLMSRFRYMSYGMIAEEMKVSKKTVEKYISEALSILRAAARRAGNG